MRTGNALCAIGREDEIATMVGRRARWFGLLEAEEFLPQKRLGAALRFLLPCDILGLTYTADGTGSMSRLRNKDWWLGRTEAQKVRKDAARKEWDALRGREPAAQVAARDETPAAPPPSDRPHSGQVLDRFYQQQDLIVTAEEAGRYDQALENATEAAASLRSVVAAWESEARRVADAVGKPFSEDWFDIRSIVAVDTICRLAPIRQDLDLLDWLHGHLSGVPELSGWLPQIDSARADVTTVRHVLSTVEAQPGVEQASLPKRLGVEGPHLRELVYRLEQDGQIVRVKSGRTYALSLK